MKLIPLLLLISTFAFAQKERLTFGPNAGQMPTVIFEGDANGGYIKIYVGENATPGEVVSINIGGMDKSKEAYIGVKKCVDDNLGFGVRDDSPHNRVYVYCGTALKKGYPIVIRYRTPQLGTVKNRA